MGESGSAMRALGIIERANALCNLDALIIARLIAIHVVFGSGMVVLDVDLLHEHVERSFLEISDTACPLLYTCRLLWITSRPDPQAYSARGLWIILATERDRVVVVEGTGEIAVNPPFEFVGHPIGRVIMPAVLWGSAIAVVCSKLVHGIVDGTVIGGSVALAEEVCLDVCGIPTHEFPIDLVEVVRLENDG